MNRASILEFLRDVQESHRRLAARARWAALASKRIEPWEMLEVQCEFTRYLRALQELPATAATPAIAAVEAIHGELHATLCDVAWSLRKGDFAAACAASGHGCGLDLARVAFGSALLLWASAFRTTNAAAPGRLRS